MEDFCFCLGYGGDEKYLRGGPGLPLYSALSPSPPSPPAQCPSPHLCFSFGTAPSAALPLPGCVLLCFLFSFLPSASSPSLATLSPSRFPSAVIIFSGMGKERRQPRGLISGHTCPWTDPLPIAPSNQIAWG